MQSDRGVTVEDVSEKKWNTRVVVCFPILLFLILFSRYAISVDTDFNDEAKADLTAMGYPDAIVRGMGGASCSCSDRPGSTCEESLERVVEQYVPLPDAVVAGFYWFRDPEYMNGCGYMGWSAMGCWKQCGEWQDPDLEALTLVAGVTKWKVESKELKEGEAVSAYFPLGS